MRLKISLGLRTYIVKTQKLTTDVDLVTVSYWQTFAAGLDTIYPDAALGKYIVYTPLAPVTAAQNGGHTAYASGR